MNSFRATKKLNLYLPVLVSNVGCQLLFLHIFMHMYNVHRYTKLHILMDNSIDSKC